MKRRHHNTKGTRQIRRGKTRDQVAAMAKRLGIPLATANPCPMFRPDHNGECLNCDEWALSHSAEAIDAGERDEPAR